MKPNPAKSHTVAVSLAALLAITSVVRADVEDKVTKSFTAAPGGQLFVELDRGSIEIKTAEAGSVDIEITSKAGGSRSQAEKTLADHIVTLTQTDNGVQVRSEYQGPRTRRWFGSSPQLQVQCVITVPREFDVDLKTAGGSINVTRLTGKLQANTAGGSLRFESIEGPISGHTSGGSIYVHDAKGKVNLRTAGGTVNLKAIEGNVNAHTSGGSIRAESLTGEAVVKTSGGSIQVADIKGAIEAGTSGGSITATLLEQPAKACSFKTSGGSITLVLDAQVAVDVDARTSGGRVTTDFPVVSVVQGEQKKHELRGKINGGGPLLTAHTSGGSVRLQQN
ncbi:MAG: DUF4097 family beta strand repeat protein [Verrucomicrobiae bacterium]|nr:DUF4097 family beta strand repeat protein [Verrucomicrobiae bacterium]